MLTQKQFVVICSLVYKEIGISLNQEKRQLVESRLFKRLRALGLDSADDYLRLIRKDHNEKTNFFDAISTNHTYFFRESQHFDCLQPHHLLIWSCACSSGEEPYSIAIYCLEKGFKPVIHATDISIQMLTTAQKGIYPVERIKNIPPNLRSKYFLKGIGKRERYVKVKPVIRNMVYFDRFNLLKDRPSPEKYDVIFCRNVLIYFDTKTRNAVVSRLYDALRYEGYFIVGGAESLSSINHRFAYIRPNVYKKSQHS